MKKITLILMMAFAIFTLPAQSEELPEVIYMVGNMNDWVTPIDGGTQYPIYVESNGEDYTYSAEFNIPAQDGGLQFKFFTKVAGWTYGSYLSTSNDPFTLYKDAFNNIGLTFSPLNNVVIRNWKGGILKIKVEYYTGSGAWRCEVEAPDQPELPEFPKEIYLIGDFNNWQLPTADNLNGAQTIPLGENYYYQGSSTFAEGQASFYIITFDPETGETVKWGHQAPFSAFQIYQMVLGETGMVDMMAYSETMSDIVPFTIADWKGGNLDIVAFMNRGEDKYFPMYIYNYDAPVFDIPNPKYGVYDTGDGESDVLSLPVTDGENNYTNHVWSTGSDVQIFFSSEESLQYDPSHCWGIMEDIDIDKPNEVYSIVKGGKPLRANFGSVSGQIGRLLVVVDWRLGIAYVNITKDSAVEEVEVCEPLSEPIYFNLQGLKVDNPSAGIYIKVNGGKREKIIIK